MSRIEPLQQQAPKFKENKSTASVAVSAPETITNEKIDFVQTTDYEQLYLMADDLSAVVSQFRRRAAAEKQSPNTTDPFDRMLEEESEKKLDQLLTVISTGELNQQALYNYARSLFPDDSDLVLVLREIIKKRKLAQLDTNTLEELETTVWEQSNKKQCQAGINIGIKARLFSEKMTVTPTALRQTYREFITSDEAEIDQYEQWVANYEPTRRGLITEFIETALVHDIQSHDPSCSRQEFGNLLHRIVKLKKITSSDRAFMQVFAKECQHEKNSESSVLACWFDCLKRPFKIQKAIDQHTLNTVLPTLNLTQQQRKNKLLRAIKGIDEDLFFAPEIKHILIEALLGIK